jgi:arylsulfatase A-like enzyme
MRLRPSRLLQLCIVCVLALAVQSSYASESAERIRTHAAHARLIRSRIENMRRLTWGADRSAPLTRHVVVISMDGLRPESIDRFGAVTIQRLMQQGSYALQAQTVQPSKTLPAHASMLSGVEPRIHGMTWNQDAPGTLALPTVFDLATQAGLTSAAFFSKAKLGQLTAPGDVGHLEVRSRWSLRSWDADHTIDEVRDYLQDGNRPNLMFIHVAEPDQTGHDHGWMSAEYGVAVQEADQALAELLAAADGAFGKGQYTVILTADHGGVGHGHAEHDPRSTRIPWVTWGKGVKCGFRVKTAVHTTDTAATVAWLLRLGTPRNWTGRPVKAAYGRQNGTSC